jgi:ubiquinone biosynthesis protein
MLQKTMVVVEGVARKLNPNTNIWETSKPVLENWLKETKDPINSLNEKKSEMIAFKNQSIVGLLLLVIFGLLVF